MRKRLLAAGGSALVLLGLLAGWWGLSRTRSQLRVVLVIPDPPPEPAGSWFAGVDTSHTAAFSPDGRSVLVARMNRGIERWDIASGTLQRTFAPAATGARRFGFCAWSPGGDLVAGTTDQGVAVWNANDGRLLWRSRLDHALAFSPDGTKLAAFRHDFEIQVRDARTGDTLQTLEIQRANGGWHTFTWSPGGRYLLACDPLVCIVWDMTTGEEHLRLRDLDMRQPPPHFRALDDPMLALLPYYGRHVRAEFLPDDSAVVVYYADSLGPAFEGTQLLPSPDDVAYAAAGPSMNRVRAYRLDDQRILWDVPCPAKLLHGALSHDGTRFAVGCFRQPVRIHDAATGRLLQTCQYDEDRQEDDACKVFWTPDDAQIVAFQASEGDDNFPFRLFDVTSGRRLEVRNEHGSPLFDVRFTPDGRRMVTTDHNLTHRIWERKP